MKYDNQGFIIGNKQLEQLNRGIHRIDLNVEQILSLLLDTQSSKIGSTVLAQNKTTNVVQENLAQQKQNIYAQNKNNTRQARAITQQAKQIKQQNERLAKAEQVIIDRQKNKTAYTPELKNERLRNAKGQFVKADDLSADVGKSKNGRESNLTEMSVNIPQGLDPTLDAIGEITDITSSIANKFSWVKRLKFWRNQEKHQREERRLLRLLLGKFKNGRGFLSNLFGGFGGKAKNSNLLKFLGKFLKRIPILGALLGGGLLLSDWGNLDTVGKGKAVGELGGGLAGGAVGAVVGTMILPVVGTIIGGLLGAWLGSEAGESIGGAIAPHFKNFTSKSLATWRLVNQQFLANLGRVGQFVMTSFNAVIDGFIWVKDSLKLAFDSTVKFISDIFTGIVDKIKQALAFVPNVVNTGQSLYEKAVDGVSSFIEKTVNFFSGGSTHDGTKQLVAVMGKSKLGDTGIGLDHFDIRYSEGTALRGKEMKKEHLERLQVMGKSLTSYHITSGFGKRDINVDGASKFHLGNDYGLNGSFGGNEQSREMYSTYPVKSIKTMKTGGGGHQTVVTWQDGVSINILHQNKSGVERVIHEFNQRQIQSPEVKSPPVSSIQQPQVKTTTTQAPKQATPVKMSSPVINAQVPTIKQAKLSQVPKPPTESFQVSSHTIKVSVNPSQVGQNVSHQDLAHIITGGFGNNQREQV